MARPLLSRMHRFVEFINSGNESIGADVVSESASFHVPFSETPLKGISGYMQILGMMRSAYPDIQWTLDDTVIEDDRVVAQFTIRGAHQGEFFWCSGYWEENPGTRDEHLSVRRWDDYRGDWLA